MQASFGNIYSTVSLEKEYAVQGFGKIALFQSVSIYGLQFPTPAIACIYKLRDQDELEELYTKGQTQCLVKVYDGVLFRTCMSHYLYNSWTWPSPLLLIGVRVWCVMFCVGGLNHAIKRNKLLKCTAVACLFLRRIVLEVDILCKRFNMHRVWHMIYRSISSFFSRKQWMCSWTLSLTPALSLGTRDVPWMLDYWIATKPRCRPFDDLKIDLLFLSRPSISWLKCNNLLRPDLP